MIDVPSTLSVEGKRSGGRALVLKPLLSWGSASLSGRDSEAVLAEAVGLAEAIDLKVVKAQCFQLSRPTPSMLISSGLVQEWREFVELEQIELVVLDHVLSPVQQRNLEKSWKCKVIDRTGLILEIFGARARTREGQLQVELAALSYQKSRLVRSWTHLERQRGGFGFMGGPGESQLEIDRRLITNRISRLKEDLKQVRRTRSLGRKAREKAEHPTIALVGYTNAGKSTLFNRLTGADVIAKDMLFATLDPSMRGLKLPSGREVILSDTVGFISDLPTHLVEAFRATLEEVQCADLILHVRDIMHPEARAQKEAVEFILGDLGIDAEDERLIEVLNKADLLPEEELVELKAYAAKHSRDAHAAPSMDGVSRGARGGTAAVSALTGEGVEDLLALLDKALAERSHPYQITFARENGAVLAWLHAHGNVVDRREKAAQTTLVVHLDEPDFGRFVRRFGEEVHVES